MTLRALYGQIMLILQVWHDRLMEGLAEMG